MYFNHKTWINIVSISVLSLIFTCTFANQQFLSNSMTHGFYVGAQAGYGEQDFKIGNAGTNQFDGLVVTSVSTQKSNEGLAGRIMAGYAFNPYFSLEVGATKYDDLDWLVTTRFQSGLQSSIRMITDTYVLDLLGKISYPATQHFILFAKGGLAYVHTDNSFTGGFEEDMDNYRPEVAAGFSVPINHQVAIDTTYSHVFSKGNLHLNNYSPSLNAVLIGVTISHL